MTTRKGIEAMRFGFGPKAGKLPALAPADQLNRNDPSPGRHPARSTAETLALHQGVRAKVRAMKAGTPEARELQREGARMHQAQALVHLQVELARAIDAEDGYRERLVRFWSDHFTVRAKRQHERPLPTAFADEAIRPNLTAPFAQLLRAAVLHPAMLFFLDQTTSVGPESPFGQRRGSGLNENLARELLELHTLGVNGTYDQADVRQLAKLLTGLGVTNGDGMIFDPRRAQPGAETVLGRVYGSDRPARLEDVLAVLDDLATHPETASHLSRKLAVHFVSDTPTNAMVEDIAAIWVRSGGDLKAVSLALCTHPDAQSEVLAKARQPFDFVVAACRALDIDGAAIKALSARDLRRGFVAPLALMGQRWQEPGGPDGWEEATEHWITPQGLAARIDWAMRMPGRLRRKLPDARDFVDHALVDLAGPELRQLVARAEHNAEGVGLVLASPLFNRR